MLVRVYHSCVGCILVAGGKENSSRSWLMCTFPWLWYLLMRRTFVCSSQWDVQSVGCSTSCCVLSTGSHLLASGPQGKQGMMEHFSAPRQGAQLEDDLAACPWCPTATAWSCQQGRGLPDSPQIRGLTSACLFNSSARRFFCPATAWQRTWEAFLVSSEEPQEAGSTAWKSQWGLPSMEGTRLLTQESIFGSQHVSSCWWPQCNNVLINVEGCQLIGEKVFLSSRLTDLVRYQTTFKSAALR